MAPSEIQLKYALVLLRAKGYSVEWMNSRYKDLGVTMRKRQGKVTDWLASLNATEVSELINKLKLEEDA